MPSPAVSCANHPDQLAAATCGRCGDFICAACAHSVEASALCGRCVHSAASGPAPIPWESRGDRGWMVAWWATTWEALRSPRALLFGGGFFERIGARGGYGPATGYAVISLGAWVLAEGGVWMLQMAALVRNLPPEMRWDSGPGAALVMVVPTLLALLALLVPLLYLQAAVVHTAGMVFGAERGGFRGTLRACAYSTGVWGLAALPILPLILVSHAVPSGEGLLWISQVCDMLGFLVFLTGVVVWGSLLRASLSAVHEVAGWRSLGVVLSICGLVAGCGCGVIFVLPGLLEYSTLQAPG